ncbi:hypothetical protein NY667_04660 [Xanthomonas hortorum pv. hederae]|uniref:Uncharacterized protein n=1 Tax=Xanthomonas hortorum pv. hederae TaxID=453603 RepID=A0A9X4BNW7_9XANT|nr:hypothetical protein [Xanthomonas hortorum]MDC8637113.1 hypothetical protein [Xanthomonas hortorum pv. hederae]
MDASSASLDSHAGVGRHAAIVLAALSRAALLACIAVLAVLPVFLDVHWLHNTIGEWSLVESSQLLLLGATVAAFIRLARHSPEDRRFAVLAAGLFACMLIRELDVLWDQLAERLWYGLVAAVAVGCLVYGLRQWRAALAGLARFLSARTGTVLVTGLVVVLVYSRLMGMGGLWRDLLDAHYLRVFKNAVEEGLELLGYLLILASSLGYVRRRLRAAGLGRTPSGTSYADLPAPVLARTAGPVFTLPAPPMAPANDLPRAPAAATRRRVVTQAGRPACRP